MAEQRRIDMATVQQQVTRLHEFLSKADTDRLQAVLACFASPQATQVSLATCPAAVAAGSSLDKQLADFRAFRQRLHKASRRVRLGW